MGVVGFTTANAQLTLLGVNVEESLLRGVLVRVDSCSICHSDMSILDL